MAFVSSVFNGITHRTGSSDLGAACNMKGKIGLYAVAFRLEKPYILQDLTFLEIIPILLALEKICGSIVRHLFTS